MGEREISAERMTNKHGRGVERGQHIVEIGEGKVSRVGVWVIWNR
jgi:hypothetical protein